VPTAALETLGCKVNQYETERLLERFAAEGFEIVSADRPADVYVVNTCSVTGVAEAKSRRLIAKLARQHPQARVVVTGCDANMALMVGRTFPAAALLVTNERKADLVTELLNAAPDLRDSCARVRRGSGQPGVGGGGTPQAPKAAGIRTRAVVKIQDGCDMHCTYCSVPLTRGPVRSRPLGEIEEEVAGLVSRGRREIVLTGILVGAYGQDMACGMDLADVIRRVGALPGVARARLSSVEPTHVTQRLLDAMRETPAVCPHLHIPLQSGDDAVLSAMRRPYDRGFYRDVCGQAARSMPDLAITTDVMVGFPGETDEAHAATIALARDVGFARMHVFRYSARPGTPAAGMAQPVAESVKAQRASEMAAVATSLRRAFASRFLGRSMDVLAEPDRADGAVLAGYTANYIRVRFPSAGIHAGEVVPVLLARLLGDVVEGTATQRTEATSF